MSAASRPPAALVALPLLVLVLAGCRSLPPGRLPEPEIVVKPRTGPKPHRVSAVAIRADHPDLEAAVRRSGVGLRVAGDRQGLVLRYAALDPAAEGVLVRTLGLAERFGRPVPFGGGNVLEIRAMRAPPESRGFIVHAVAAPDLSSLDVGVIARPPNGAILPVIRGSVPVAGSGAILLTGEADGRPAFAAILKIAVEGARIVGRVARPDRHALTIRAFVVPNDVASRALDRLGREEKGSEGGVAVYGIRDHEVEDLEEYLAAGGDRLPVARRVLRSGDTTAWARGRLHLEVKTHFSLRDYSYETQVTSSPLRKVNHGERDAILVVGWDAERPGRTVAAILGIRPEE